MSQDRILLLRESESNSITPENRGYESLNHSPTIQTANTPTNSIPSGTTCPQYVAALSATLSALASGAVLGWTSPILSEIQNGKFHNIPVDSNQMGWIGSFVTLGAMTMCFPTGFICDMIGRKKALLLLIVPFTVGWLLILFAQNVLMLYFGRLITGMAVGACCVAAPLYNSEIAQKEIRGTLGSYFQLMITIGIFLAYLIGKFLSPINYTIFCACLPFLFLIVFSFQPETPLYNLKNNLHDKAFKSLLKLRGNGTSDEEIQIELNETENIMKENIRTSVSLIESLKKKSLRRALLISFALMFFQQFSGINAIILYTSDIFNSSKVRLDANTAAIIVGGFQAIATFISSLVIDRLGRRLLLLLSSLIMSLSTILLAIYFTLKYRCQINETIMNELNFLPILSLCVFVIVFSIGFGPIPWMISSEIYPTQIRSIASSATGTFNWFLAFIITKFYLQLNEFIGQDSTFYIFSIISFVGGLFVYFIVPETKGKSVEEIQIELNQ